MSHAEQPKAFDPAREPYAPVEALIAALEGGRCTARQLLDAQLARIEALDGQLNAVVVVDAERARAAADAVDARRVAGEAIGPLAGLSMTVKESMDVPGLPTTLNLPWLRNNRPSRAAAVVARVQAADGIVLGKTAIPFASYDFQTAPPGRPRTANPHDISRTPGGSSGGPAAALAAGFTALEIGSDVAGSIRIPASFCGVAGLRPSEGALPQEGHAMVHGAPMTMRHLSTVGPMARTVAGCARLFEVMRTPTPAQGPERPLHPAGSVSLSGLRLGWSPRLGGVHLGRAVDAAFADLRRRLSDHGARLTEVDPGEALDIERGWSIWGRIQGAELRDATPAPLRWGLFNWINALGLRLWQGRSALSRSVIAGLLGSRMGYLAALDARDAYAATFDRWVGQFDGWLVPAAPEAIAHQRTGKPITLEGATRPYGELLGTHCCALVAAGVPCLTIPMAHRGLPVGVQIVVPRWHDHRALAIGEAIERALGPGFRAPPL